MVCDTVIPELLKNVQSAFKVQIKTKTYCVDHPEHVIESTATFLQQNAFKIFQVHSGPTIHNKSICVAFVGQSDLGAANATQVSISALLVRSPESQVVSQKLHDQSRILVGVFCHIVKLCNGVLKGCAGHFASFIRIIQHLIHEH